MTTLPRLRPVSTCACAAAISAKGIDAIDDRPVGARFPRGSLDSCRSSEPLRRDAAEELLAARLRWTVEPSAWRNDPFTSPRRPPGAERSIGAGKRDGAGRVHDDVVGPAARGEVLWW